MSESFKTLKFRRELSELILKGEKFSTWRLFDDKDLSVGDEVVFLVWEDLSEFARVRLIEVFETKFGDLTEEDWEGHETYSSDEEMFEVFSGFYNREVDADSPVKIIKFEFISKK